MVRRGILQGAELTPVPARSPLEPATHGLQQGDGYTVENVRLSSVPGFYISGNLYRPIGRTGLVPAVLLAHGHFALQIQSVRTGEDIQRAAAQLARMGAVVFAWDMVGYGDALQIIHRTQGVLTFQLWNAVRALDYVIGLPEVDPDRIAIAGASGGGTQTFLLTAIDIRIAASVPIVMVSSSHDGGDECEIGMPVREDAGTNNVEIAALAAPRPQLLISDGEDWTSEFPRIDLPYMQMVYRLYDVEPLVVNVHLAGEGHDFGPSKRAALYQFLAEHLGLQPVDEPEIEPLPEASLRVYDALHPPPADALRSGEEVWAAIRELQQRVEEDPCEPPCE